MISSFSCTNCYCFNNNFSFHKIFTFYIKNVLQFKCPAQPPKGKPWCLGVSKWSSSSHSWFMFSAHWIQGCVGPRAGLDALEKREPLSLAGNLSMTHWLSVYQLSYCACSVQAWLVSYWLRYKNFLSWNFLVFSVSATKVTEFGNKNCKWSITTILSGLQP